MLERRDREMHVRRRQTKWRQGENATWRWGQRLKWHLYRADFQGSLSTTRIQEETKKDLHLELSEITWPSWHLDFRFLAARIVRQLISIPWSHQICTTLSRQLSQTNTKQNEVLPRHTVMAIRWWTVIRVTRINKGDSGILFYSGIGWQC